MQNMKTFPMIKYMLPVALLLATTSAHAAVNVEVKDAYKAMLQINTYNGQGQLLKSGPAFFINSQGDAVAAYNLLKGAQRAEVIDYKGKKYSVFRILGANSNADLVKFSIKGVNKNEYFSLTSTTATQGTALTLLHYTQNKKEVMPQITITNAVAYAPYSYYDVSATNDSLNFNCPLIDNQGILTAVVQRNAGKNASHACAVDARFINDLTINATAAFNSDLTSIAIPKALPQERNDALTYLYMLSQNDSIACMNAYNDFIDRYPTIPEGYLEKAKFKTNRGLYAQAEADFTTAFDKAKNSKDSAATKEDAIHYTLSNMIYKKIMEQGRDTLSNGWNLKRAEEEAVKAYAIQPNALYKVQEGNCQYAEKDYQSAYESFKKACEDKDFASSETFFSAARSLELAKGDSKEVIALLDSCISLIPANANANYAQFYFERSQRLINAGKYRDAVADYNQYEQMVGPRNLSEQFYYLRSQAEEKAHMYQQAIDDLHSAIAMSKHPVLYQIDEAALLLNIGETKSAIAAAEKILKVLPENPDCYKIIGVGYGQLKNKPLALKYLNKARELGDESVVSLIEKFK